MSAGAGGGSGGDDLLQKLADAAQTGKAADVQRLADELDEDALAYVLRTDTVDSANRLLDRGIDSDEISDLTRKEIDLNAFDQNLRNIDQYQGGKLSGTFKAEDVTRYGENPNGEQILLSDSDKWLQSKTSLAEIPDFRHVIARHVHPNSQYKTAFTRQDAFGTAPAKIADDQASLFYKQMSPDEVQDLIMRSASEGRIVNDGTFSQTIKYDVPNNYPYNIDEMTVVIRKKEGLVKTAYPSGNSAPKFGSI